MAESKFRIWAKTVAIVELVLYAFSAALFLLLAVALAVVGTAEIFGEDKPKVERTGDNDEQAAEAIGAGLAGVGVIVGVLLLIILMGFLALHIWFSYNLLQATHIGADTFSALQKSRRWRIFAIVLFVLSLLSLARVHYLPVTVIGFIFRGVGLWIVHSFIKDLESCEQQPQQPHKTTDYDMSKPPPYSQMA